jgi:hypothetical protein
LHETVSFEPESVPKFDLDFQLDEPVVDSDTGTNACAEAHRT